MDSRRKAGGAVARLSELSRRAVLVGASATPAFAGAEANVPADPTIAICQRWLAVDAKMRRLQLAWSNHETWLARAYGWLRLSASERAAVPEGATLAEIDARLDALEAEGEALLKGLPPTPATSVAAVIANLTVAGVLLAEEDRPEARGLILRAIRDLAVLYGQR